MSAYSLSHLSDPVLLRDLRTLLAQDRATTATLLAHLAEVDARKLYLPAAYPSMYAWCVGELHLSEDAAFKRIRAARTARRFPALFGALADGRLHLAAIVLLAPHLTPENADELLAAATHQSKAGIERLIAERFPQLDVPEQVSQLAPGRVESHPVLSVPGRMEAPGPSPRVAPLSSERYALQLTLGRATHDKLRYAQELLGHQLPSGDLAAVLDRALDALIERLEKRKLAASARPQRSARPSTNPRHIPAHVRRAVWERDHGQCTFVSEAGHRCPARARLETIWNDGLAVVTSSCLREEKPTAVARGHRGSRVSASGARAAYERSPS